ncbi:hypothetical protein K1719_007683 [Acacia pycnantha]|nr:hypothetical protein K1719_007683 [Acacia pycnantha]
MADSVVDSCGLPALKSCIEILRRMHKLVLVVQCALVKRHQGMVCPIFDGLLFVSKSVIVDGPSLHKQVVLESHIL